MFSDILQLVINVPKEVFAALISSIGTIFAAWYAVRSSFKNIREGERVKNIIIIYKDMGDLLEALNYERRMFYENSELIFRFISNSGRFGAHIFQKLNVKSEDLISNIEKIHKLLENINRDIEKIEMVDGRFIVFKKTTVCLTMHLYKILIYYMNGIGDCISDITKNEISLQDAEAKYGKDTIILIKRLTEISTSISEDLDKYIMSLNREMKLHFVGDVFKQNHKIKLDHGTDQSFYDIHIDNYMEKIRQIPDELDRIAGEI